MLCADAFEFVAGERLHRFPGWFETGGGTKLGNEFVGENESFCSGRGGPSHVRAAEFLNDINFFRMNCDKQVCWQRPWRCCPDRHTGLVFERARNNWKLHEHGGVIAFLIFHFGFREGGLRAGAPENRLQRFVNQTFLNEDGEGAQNLRLVSGIHGEIGMFPIAENAEAFELFALNIDKFARESFATFADLAPLEVRKRSEEHTSELQSR